MGYKGSLKTEYESRYCPLCDNLEQYEAILESPLNKLDALLREIRAARQEVVDLFVPLRLRFKELEERHLKCPKCEILIGKGHLEKNGYEVNGLLYCGACKKGLNRNLTTVPRSP